MTGTFLLNVSGIWIRNNLVFALVTINTSMVYLPRINSKSGRSIKSLIHDQAFVPIFEVTFQDLWFTIDKAIMSRDFYTLS